MLYVVLDLSTSNRKEQEYLFRSAGLFTMDVIGSAAFGVDLDCRRDPNNNFAVMGRRFFDINIYSLSLTLISK